MYKKFDKILKQITNLLCQFSKIFRPQTHIKKKLNHTFWTMSQTNIHKFPKENKNFVMYYPGTNAGTVAISW